MNTRAVDAFFKAVSQELHTPLVVVLTGGIAASLLGDARVTDDVDFAIQKFVKKHLPSIENTLEQAAKRHGVIIQYSTDIDRWSQVSYLDWSKHSRPHKKFGHLEVRVLDPYYWSIGKIARGMTRDLKDLRAVIKKQKLDLAKLAKLWAKALKNSPSSIMLANVKRQMTAFLTSASKGRPNAASVSTDYAGVFQKELEKAR